MPAFALALGASLALAKEPKFATPEPPAAEEGAAEPRGIDLSTELGSEMSGEFAKVQDKNLETAAAASPDELAKTCLFADRILQDATAQSPGATALAKKAHAWSVAYHGLGLVSDAQRDRFRRQGYRPANRAGDLRKARKDAASASKRYGLAGLPSSSEAVAKALEDAVAELDALGQTTVHDQLERESALLRAQLMLRAADRKIAGRPLD